jgi:hypothetical protein
MYSSKVLAVLLLTAVTARGFHLNPSPGKFERITTYRTKNVGAVKLLLTTKSEETGGGGGCNFQWLEDLSNSSPRLLVLEFHLVSLYKCGRFYKPPTKQLDRPELR